ncbi:hypothetical protein AVEN_76523-1 [Araneus ventricosus]|uniref:Reverse transcriptase zinc-binding domain-containing protein n=1 Tax=Araneus ventricosus TaxID=182803 RepID=A0A4Y2CDJ0_ARAVE|nr:hypothetical protein AVEN_76523-1 [Araneus ventricosus]
MSARLFLAFFITRLNKNRVEKYKFGSRPVRLASKWSRFQIIFCSEHGPFTTYLHRFHVRSTDLCSCVEVGSPIHFATSCPLASSWHFSAPSSTNLFLWKKGFLKNAPSRSKSNNLIKFLLEYDYHNNDSLGS